MNTIPLEILSEILSFMVLKRDADNIRLVCKSWHTIYCDLKLYSTHLVSVPYHKDSLVPPPRVCAAVWKFPGSSTMYIYGGHHGNSKHVSGIKSDMWTFDFKTKIWNEVPGTSSGFHITDDDLFDKELSARYPLRTEHSADINEEDGKVYSFGGYGDGPRNSQLSVIDCEKQHCSVSTDGSSPCSRSAHSGVLYKGNYYIFGGWGGWMDESYNDLHRYEISTQTWHVITPYSIHQEKLDPSLLENPRVHEIETRSPPPIRSHACVLYDGSIYIFGGFGFGLHNPDLFRFDIEQNKWFYVKTKGKKPSVRSRARAVVHKGFMYIFGGYDRVNHLADMHKYEFATRTWSEVPVTFDPKGLAQYSMIVHDDILYMFGGYQPSCQDSVNKMWGIRLDL